GSLMAYERGLRCFWYWVLNTAGGGAGPVSNFGAPANSTQEHLKRPHLSKQRSKNLHITLHSKRPRHRRPLARPAAASTFAHTGHPAATARDEIPSRSPAPDPAPRSRPHRPPSTSDAQ